MEKNVGADQTLYSQKKNRKVFETNSAEVLLGCWGWTSTTRISCSSFASVYVNPTLDSVVMVVCRRSVVAVSSAWSTSEEISLIALTTPSARAVSELRLQLRATPGISSLSGSHRVEHDCPVDRRHRRRNICCMQQFEVRIDFSHNTCSPVPVGDPADSACLGSTTFTFRSFVGVSLSSCLLC